MCLHQWTLSDSTPWTYRYLQTQRFAVFQMCESLHRHARVPHTLLIYTHIPAWSTYHPGTCLDPHVCSMPHQMILMTYPFTCLCYIKISSGSIAIAKCCEVWSELHTAFRDIIIWEAHTSWSIQIMLNVQTQEDASIWTHFGIHVLSWMPGTATCSQRKELSRDGKTTAGAHWGQLQMYQHLVPYLKPWRCSQEWPGYEIGKCTPAGGMPSTVDMVSRHGSIHRNAGMKLVLGGG